MTRARILADYVAGGTTAAEFDYLDGLTSAAVGINDTQTLTNKTLTSPTIGNLSNVTGTLPVGVTGGSGLTALGTVTAGNLSNTAIVYPVGHVIQVVGNQTAFDSSSDFAVSASTVKDADGEGLTISGVTAGNLLKINIAGGYHRMYFASSSVGGCNWKIVASPNTGADTLVSGTRLYMRDMTSDYHHIPISLVGIYIVPSGVTSVEILRELTAETGNASWNNTTSTPMSVSIMEIQQ